MSLTGPRFTYEDYKLLPEERRYELVEGELLVTPAPGIWHQRLLRRLLIQITAFVEARGLGEVLPAPTDVVLSNENVVQPDLLFVAAERLAILDPVSVRGAPDLIVEILSPSTAGRDQVAKRKLYAQYGVREYWLVDPAARTVEVSIQAPMGLETWRVFPVGSAVTSPLLTGLLVPVSELFQE